MDLGDQPFLAQLNGMADGSARYSTRAILFNSKGVRHLIDLDLTEQRLCLSQNRRLLREVNVDDVEAVTISDDSQELVVHVCEDSDERLCFKEDRNKFIENLIHIRQQSQKRELVVFVVRDINLNRFVTTEDNIEEGVLIRPESSLRRHFSLAGFREYLRQKELEAQSNRNSTKNILEKDNTHLSIEDFDLIQTLGKGAYGKVLLVERKSKRGVFYAMKIIRKEKLIRLNQIKNAKTEKYILQNICHPHIVSLKHAFQTQTKIYLVMEFMKGGDLFQNLKKVGRFTETQVKFFVACLILGLGKLHASDYIYRDLKPENVLLTENGYAKLADFGLVRFLKETEVCRSFCGTKEYLPPEVLLRVGYNRPADWWGLGIMIYELLYGLPPFYHSVDVKMFDNILNGPLKFKLAPQISDDAKNFISQLLVKDPAKRLGSVADALEVMNHPWLRDIPWSAIYAGTAESPYKPLDVQASLQTGTEHGLMREAPIDSICYLDPLLESQFTKDFEIFNYDRYSDAKGPSQKHLSNRLVPVDQIIEVDNDECTSTTPETHL